MLCSLILRSSRTLFKQESSGLVNRRRNLHARGPGSWEPGPDARIPASCQLPAPVASEFDANGWLATIVSCLSCASSFSFCLG
jgi:hypothetical protein